MIPEKLSSQIERQITDTKEQALLSASMLPVCDVCAINPPPAKPVHGEPQEMDVPGDMVPIDPHGSGFKKGDKVIFTNDYGVKFALVVRGFAKEKHSSEFPNPRWVYVFKDAWWFPVKPDSLKIKAPHDEPTPPTQATAL